VATVGNDAEPADFPIRRILIAALSASAAEDLFLNTRWRGLWLAEQIEAMITPEPMANPAVSLAMLRLDTQLALAGSNLCVFYQIMSNSCRCLCPGLNRQAFGRADRREPIGP
jgi:hypothetical protein